MQNDLEGEEYRRLTQYGRVTVKAETCEKNQTSIEDTNKSSHIFETRIRSFPSFLLLILFLGGIISCGEDPGFLNKVSFLLLPAQPKM